MYLAILCVPVTSAGTAARVHVCHSHMQIVMPAACDSFAPVLLLLRQDGKPSVPSSALLCSTVLAMPFLVSIT